MCDVYQEMIGKLERERDEALKERDEARNYHGCLRGEAAKFEKRARDAEEQLVKAVHIVRPTTGEGLLDAARRIVRQRDDLFNECADLRERVGAVPKPEPLTVADVERIVDATLRDMGARVADAMVSDYKMTRRVDAKFGNVPREAGAWIGKGVHRVRNWPGPMVAAHVTPNGWHVYGETGGLLASGKDGGAEGERMADAVLRAMGVTLRG
jgi:hypothetical protein